MKKSFISIATIASLTATIGPTRKMIQILLIR